MVPDWSGLQERIGGEGRWLARRTPVKERKIGKWFGRIYSTPLPNKTCLDSASEGKISHFFHVGPRDIPVWSSFHFDSGPFFLSRETRRTRYHFFGHVEIEIQQDPANGPWTRCTTCLLPESSFWQLKTVTAAPIFLFATEFKVLLG